MEIGDVRDIIFYIAGRRMSTDYKNYKEEREKIEEIIDKLDEFTIKQCVFYTDREINDITTKIKRLELARTCMRATNTMLRKNLLKRENINKQDPILY